MLYIKLSEEDAEIAAETRGFRVRLPMSAGMIDSHSDGFWKNVETTRGCLADLNVFCSMELFLPGCAWFCYR